MRCLLLSALCVLVLATAETRGAETKPVKVLIITGDEFHKWRETAPFLQEVLNKAGHKVDITEAPPAT